MARKIGWVALLAVGLEFYSYMYRELVPAPLT